MTHLDQLIKGIETNHENPVWLTGKLNRLCKAGVEKYLSASEIPLFVIRHDVAQLLHFSPSPFSLSNVFEK